jgi:hypothetical protein
MPVFYWTTYFLEAQGLGVNNKNFILFQDNQSAIPQEKNGKASGSKRTKSQTCNHPFSLKKY